MTRSQIRYALFRCKAGTPDKEHEEVLATFKSQLDEYGFDISDFTTEWDVDKKDTSQIVTGKIVKQYQKQINAQVVSYK